MIGTHTVEDLFPRHAAARRVLRVEEEIWSSRLVTLISDVADLEAPTKDSDPDCPLKAARKHHVKSD